MRMVSCELSESVILDGRWILTVLDVAGEDVLFSVQDQQNPDYYEEFVLNTHDVAEPMELAVY